VLEGSVLTDVFRHNSESRSYLIGVFVEESRARINQLAAAEAAGDAETMQRLTHALKGSSAAVGARRLGAICLEAHQAVLAGNVDEASRLQDRLERCFEITVDLLHQGCPEVQYGELATR
jgi:HPt (histidine-containing phosphotransfer) domain-containing protein